MTHLYSPKPAALYAEISRFPGERNYVDYVENWNMAWLSHDWENGPPPDREEFQRKVFKTVNTHHVTGIVMARDVPMRDKIGRLMEGRSVEEFLVELAKEPLLKLLPLWTPDWVKKMHARLPYCINSEAASKYLEAADQFEEMLEDGLIDVPQCVTELAQSLILRAKSGST